MADPRTIQTFTCGWWYGKGSHPNLRSRAGAKYEPQLPLVYDTSQPFWLGVFHGWDYPREWVNQALNGEPVGELDAHYGGLRIEREAAELRFTMRWDGGEAVLWLPAEPVSTFLGHTLVLVPFGKEGDHMDWSDLARGEAA